MSTEQLLRLSKIYMGRLLEEHLLENMQCAQYYEQ